MLEIVSSLKFSQLLDPATTENLITVEADGTVSFRDGAATYLKNITLGTPSVLFAASSINITPASSSHSLNLAVQTAGTIFSAPATVNGTPSFRALAATDIPGLDTSKIISGTFADGFISSAAVWHAKQDALVSGTNIKTVGGQTLLGSGDITLASLNYWTLASGNVYRPTGKVFVGHSADMGAYSFQVTGDTVLAGKLNIGNVPNPGAQLEVYGGVNFRYPSSDNSAMYVRMGTYISSGLYGTFLKSDSYYSSTATTNLHLGITDGSATDKILITLKGSNSFVGIDTINPNHKLDVRGNVGIGVGYGGINSFSFESSLSGGANHATYFRGNASGTNDAVIWDLSRAGGAYGEFAIDFTGTRRFYLGGSNANPHSYVMPHTNFGIGYTNPDHKLDVNGIIRALGAFKLIPQVSGEYSADATLSYYAPGNGVYLNGNNTGFLRLNADGNQHTNITMYGVNAGGNANRIVFSTSNTLRATIEYDGKFIIGSGVNGSKIFQVNGGIRQNDVISGLVYANSIGEFQIASTSDLSSTLADTYIKNQLSYDQVASFRINGIGIFAGSGVMRFDYAGYQDIHSNNNGTIRFINSAYNASNVEIYQNGDFWIRNNLGVATAVVPAARIRIDVPQNYYAFEFIKAGASLGGMHFNDNTFNIGLLGAATTMNISINGSSRMWFGSTGNIVINGTSEYDNVKFQVSGSILQRGVIGTNLTPALIGVNAVGTLVAANASSIHSLLGGSYYIQNQNSFAQSANYWISGVGRATSFHAELRYASTEIGDIKIEQESVNQKSKLSYYWYGVESAALKFNRGGDATGGSISFWTKATGGSYTEKVWITGVGNLGVGVDPGSTKFFAYQSGSLGKFEFGASGVSTTVLSQDNIFFYNGASSVLKAAFYNGNTYLKGTVFVEEYNASTTGSVVLAPGSASTSGYIGFHKSTGVRLGYIGFSDNHLTYITEGTANHIFTGNKVLIGGSGQFNGAELQVHGSILQRNVVASSVLKILAADTNGTIVEADQAGIMGVLGDSAYIKNQFGTIQTANFRINGTGRATELGVDAIGGSVYAAYAWHRNHNLQFYFYTYGGTAANDLRLARYNDAGAYQDNILTVFRASGNVYFNNNVKIGGGEGATSYNLDVANTFRVGAQGGVDVTTMGGGAGVGSYLYMYYADGTVNNVLTGNGINALSSYLGGTIIGGFSYSNNGAKLIVKGSTAGFTATGTSSNRSVQISNYDIAYGLHFGVYGSGASWIQSGRADSTQTYDLWLQHEGSSVIIGNTSSAGSYKLQVYGDIWTNNYIYVKGTSPSILFNDTDARGAAIHVNSNLFYVLRLDNAGTSWQQVQTPGYSFGRWPLYINLETNDAYFGGYIEQAFTKNAIVYADSVGGLVSATAQNVKDLLGTGAYIQNQFTGAQADSNFWITGSGRAGYYATTGTQPRFSVTGGHTDTTMSLYSIGNGGSLHSSLDMWVSEPAYTYDGCGIGNNVNSSPYYGRRNTSIGQSYIRFYGGHIFISTSTSENLNPAASAWRFGNDAIFYWGGNANKGQLTWDSSYAAIHSINGNRLVLGVTSIDANLMTLTTSAKVLIGTTSENSYKAYINSGSSTGDGLYVNGKIFATDDIQSYSDRRLKENFKDILIGDKLKGFKIQQYNKIGDNRLQIGVIAQELKELFPQLVSKEGSYYGVSYSGVATLALGLGIENKSEIDNLKEKVVSLQKEIEELRAK